MNKKEIIISTANELFLKHGFKKITVDEICKTAHVSRKTYYTYFSNKEDVVKEVITKISDYGFQLYNEIFNNASLTFAEKMEKGTLAKIELAKHWSMEFLTDFLNLEPESELSVLYRSISERSFNLLNDILTSAQRKGEIDDGLNLNYIMWLMQKQYQIIGEQELIKMFSSVEEMVKQMTQVFVHGISKH